MTITQRDGLIHINKDGLPRWAFPNEKTNPAYNAKEEVREVSIMAISIGGLAKEFWNSVEKS